MKEAERVCSQIVAANAHYALPPQDFFYIAKGSQGHVLGQNGPRRPPWNTPKKCFLLRKRPKEDERVAQGHFHERVTESPRSHGHFVLSGPIVSFFV